MSAFGKVFTQKCLTSYIHMKTFSHVPRYKHQNSKCNISPSRRSGALLIIYFDHTSPQLLPSVIQSEPENEGTLWFQLFHFFHMYFLEGKRRVWLCKCLNRLLLYIFLNDKLNKKNKHRFWTKLRQTNFEMHCY